jgi:hypothetical protein
MFVSGIVLNAFSLRNRTPTDLATCCRMHTNVVMVLYVM